MRGYWKESISVLITLSLSFGCALREERVPDGAAERQTLDALRGPIRGDLLAAHPPDLFGVGLEEDVEEAFAELVADPVLEVVAVRAPG